MRTDGPHAVPAPAPRPDAEDRAGRDDSAVPYASFATLFSAVMLPMFMAAVDQTLLATATPRIASELGGLADVSWIIVGYLLASTLVAPVYGRLGDRFGRRNAMLGALSMFMLGSLSCALAGSMQQLIASRILQGLGGGGLMVLSHALIGEIVAPWDRPRYQTWFAMLFTTSSVVGPVLGGLVVKHGDWRWLFLANLPLGLLAGWRISRLPNPQRHSAADGPYDPVGVVLFFIAASAGLFWLGQAGQRFALVSVASGALLALTLASGTLLWRQQGRHPNGFLPLDVLRMNGVPWLCLSVIVFAATLFALVFLLPIYIQAARGGSAVTAGLQLLPLTLGLVAGSIVNGRVTLRTGRTGFLTPWGLGVSAAALLALSLLPSTQLTVTVVAAVCGLGLGAVMPNAQLASQILAGQGRLGAAAGLLAVTRSLGASVGTAAFGGLLFVLLRPPSAGPGRAALRLENLDPHLIGQSFKTVFLLLALFTLLGALAAIRAPQVPLRPTGDP